MVRLIFLYFAICCYFSNYIFSGQPFNVIRGGLLLWTSTVSKDSLEAFKTGELNIYHQNVPPLFYN